VAGRGKEVGQLRDLLNNVPDILFTKFKRQTLCSWRSMFLELFQQCGVSTHCAETWILLLLREEKLNLTVELLKRRVKLRDCKTSYQNCAAQRRPRRQYVSSWCSQAAAMVLYSRFWAHVIRFYCLKLGPNHQKWGARDFESVALGLLLLQWPAGTLNSWGPSDCLLTVFGSVETEVYVKIL
jgi:hypothetical protein